MRKILILGLLGLFLAPLAYAGNDPIVVPGVGSTRNTGVFNVNHDGDVWDEGGSGTLGTSSYPYDNLYVDEATIGGAVAVTGIITLTDTIIVPTVDIAVATPTASQVGGLFKTSSYVLYIATASDSTADWIKVGAQ